MYDAKKKNFNPDGDWWDEEVCFRITRNDIMWVIIVFFVAVLFWKLDWNYVFGLRTHN